MSASIQVLVDRHASPDDAEASGNAVLLWLTENGVIAAEPDTDAALKDFAGEHGLELASTGWPPGPGYDRWVDDPNPAMTRSLRGAWCTIELGRQVQAFPDGGVVDAHCPNGHPADEDDVLEAVSDWFEGEDVHMTCDSCGQAPPLEAYDLGPEFAIGHLAVRFQDWGRLTDSLLDELRKVLSPHATQVVVGTI